MPEILFGVFLSPKPHFMKHTLLLFVIFLYVLADAQPTINSNVIPSLGFTSRYVKAGTAAVNSFNAGASGANITWNFATLDTSGGSATQRTVLPDTTPLYSDFPGVVNIAQEVNGGLLGNVYGYAYLDNSKYEYYGTENISVVQIYSDPEKQLIFPFTYNSQFSDDFKSANNVYVGTTDVRGDAYGTLKLPTGTYPNVLRVKTIENYYTFIDGDITEDTLHYEGIYYRWYQPNTTNVLMEYSKLLQVVYYQGTRYETDSLKHLYISKTAVATGVNEVTAGFSAGVYPNPTAGNLNVNSEEIIDRAQVTNMYGQLLLVQNFDAKSFTLSLQNFASGTYYLELITPDNRRKTVRVNHY